MFRKAANINKRSLTVDTMARETGLQQESSHRLGLRDLFKRPQLTNTVLLLCLWPITALGYYGLALSMSALGDFSCHPKPYKSKSSRTKCICEQCSLSLGRDPSLLHLGGTPRPLGQVPKEQGERKKLCRRPLFTLGLLLAGLACLGAAASPAGSTAG